MKFIKQIRIDILSIADFYLHHEKILEKISKLKFEENIMKT